MPPCNCHPPFPRPEPFSPLPRPGKVPDWGKWIRDRLAEKGALLAFPTRTAFPSAGSAPNLYLAEDTGVVYRWGGEVYAVLVDPSSDIETYPGRSAFPETGRDGVIYIDASANLLYRWNGTGYVLLTTDLSGVESRLADVESKVPAQATAQNQLADKAFVNSSIATNTAFYISDNGRPFQSLADLESYEGALTNNDYAFVVGRDAAGNTTYTRYKWNEAAETWAEEYVLNNSSFTAEQWAAISSGITSGLVAKLGALPTAEALAQALAGKQDRLTFETSVTRNSGNPVKSSGIWSAIWGALASLPTGFSSLYDWCVSQLAGKEPLFQSSAISGIAIKTVAAIVKDGSLLKPIDIPTSALTVNGKELSEDVTLTADDIDYSVPGGAQSVQMTLDGMDAELSRKASKSDVEPLLFAQYYPDGSVKSAAEFTQGIKYDAPDTTNRTITVRPFCNTVSSANNSGLVGRVVIPPFVDVGGYGYISDNGKRYKVVGVHRGSPRGVNTNLTAIVAPSTVTTIGDYAFDSCTSLASVSLPAATTIGDYAFDNCTSLASVDFGDTPRLSVPSLGDGAFVDVPNSSKIVVPYTQYDAWKTADGWRDLPQEFVRHAEKADKPAAFTEGNLAALDANGNPTDSGVKASDKLDSTSAAPAFSASSTYAVGDHVTYNGGLYRCTTAVTTAGAWTGSTNWTAEDMTTPDVTLDVTATDKLLRLVATNGDVIWGQGYNLSTTSSATVITEQVSAFTFAADAVADQAIVLPTVAASKVGDFILDVTNLSANDRSLTLTGLDSAFSVVVKAGDDLSETLTVAAGEMARYYFTMTAFRVNSLPTWQVAKEAVENGGAQS